MENINFIFNAFTQDGISAGVLNEAAYLLTLLAVAWATAWLLGRQIKTESVLFGEKVVDGLMFPLLALLLAYFAQKWLIQLQPLVLFKLAVPVLLSLVLIRLCARVLMAVFPTSPVAALTERLISWLAWGFAVLWISDLVPLVVNEMEQIHLHFGKV